MANLTTIGLISTALRRVYYDQLRTWINNSRITYFQGVTIMAGNIYTWTVAAADNDDADPAINWVENQAPGTVNNSARGVMSGVACFIKDNDGSITTGGISSAYTATVNTPITALVTGNRITLKMHVSNAAGPCTLTVTSSTGASLGSKAIRLFAGVETDPAGAQLVLNGIYQFVYDSTASGGVGAWICFNPASVAPSTQIFTASGSGTYTTAPAAKWLEVMMVGGGGGGGGGNNTVATTGGNTTFSTFTANGGVGGEGISGIGGNGGAASGATINIPGGGGGGGNAGDFAETTGSSGGQGGASYFAGGGASRLTASGIAAPANSGAGGGGGGMDGLAVVSSGGGGGAGGYCYAIISAPAASYSYSVGAGGAGKAAGANGFAGAAGAAGIIIVIEHL